MDEISVILLRFIYLFFLGEGGKNYMPGGTKFLNMELTVIILNFSTPPPRNFFLRPPLGDSKNTFELRFKLYISIRL
jgi:hypothetical protein